MISKEEFVELINFIKKMNKKQEKFINILEDLSPHSYCDCFIYSDYQDKLIKFIQKDLNDKGDDITYFLYECNYIHKLDKKMCPKYNEKYLYDSLETLYDYIVGGKGND